MCTLGTVDSRLQRRWTLDMEILYSYDQCYDDQNTIVAIESHCL